ncbi:hypothetical protein UlMin_027520 [Ulmus minor]
MTTSANTTAPLIEVAGHGGDGEGRRWWKKLLDMEETKKQLLISLPMILTNVFYYLIPLVSVMFAGHLGELELAGATLANSWATVTGYAFMVGLSGALETLCGQGFGAQLFGMLGIHLQTACIMSFLFSIIISIIWFYTEPLLILVGQDAQISETAAVYTKFLIPSLFAYGFVQNILRFLQTQSIVKPLIVFSALSLLFHVGFSYCLVHWTSLGFKGAPVAASISLWLSFLMLAVYVLCSTDFKHTWKGFSMQSFNYIFTNLKLSMPSAAMILVFLAGLMPDSQITTSLIAICVNTEAIAYMFSYGLSAAASTRVSNELGAGNPDQAKHAMTVTIKISGLLSLVVIVALGFGHNIWAGFFSDSSTIIKDFASMTPFLALSIFLDFFQGILSGVARGCGWQHIAVVVNLAMFYFVGMTIAVLLAFKLKLYTKGLWIGLICGLACQSGTLLLITLRAKWSKLEVPDENKEKEDPVLV